MPPNHCLLHIYHQSGSRNEVWFGVSGAKSMFETLVLWFVPIWGFFLAQLVRRNQSWIIVPMGNHDFVRIINETYSGAESLVQSRANPTARPTVSIWAPLDANWPK